MRKLIKRYWKKASALIAAGAVGVTLSMPVMPAPTAAAGTSETIGTILTLGSMAAQISAVRRQVSQLEDTDEGREELFLQYQKEYGVNDDYALNQKMARIMTNLTNGVAAIDPTIKDKPYKWFISGDQSVNAFCSFGHVMTVNTGLFNYMPIEDEIAAVVGHEMGHGQKAHVKKGVMKNINRTFVLQLGAAAAGGGIAPSLVASVANIHLNAHSTKKQEWEADNLSFDYMKNTNYNLGAGAAVMQKFVELEALAKKRSGIEKFFNPSDHPNSEARRDNYVKKLEEYSGGHVTAKDGTVTVNKQFLMKVAETSSMSSEERSYFVLGNLAAAYHNGHSKSQAYLNGNTIMLGSQPIIELASNDEDGQIIVNRLNSIK